MYSVILDELIFKEDFKQIDPPQQQRIVKTIRKKLTQNPESYGNPLSGSLKNFWKLKIGPFRVIYQIRKNEQLVDVVLVGFRRDEEAYLQAAQRLGLI